MSIVVYIDANIQRSCEFIDSLMSLNEINDTYLTPHCIYDEMIKINEHASLGRSKMIYHNAKNIINNFVNSWSQYKHGSNVILNASPLDVLFCSSILNASNVLNIKEYKLIATLVKESNTLLKHDRLLLLVPTKQDRNGMILKQSIIDNIKNTLFKDLTNEDRGYDLDDAIRRNYDNEFKTRSHRVIVDYEYSSIIESFVHDLKSNNGFYSSCIHEKNKLMFVEHNDTNRVMKLLKGLFVNKGSLVFKQSASNNKHIIALNKMIEYNIIDQPIENKSMMFFDNPNDYMFRTLGQKKQYAYMH